VTTSNYTYDLIVKNDLMFWFQSVLEGQFELGKWGVHAGGHFTVGGDPAGDLFVSPGDPIFWLHHGMVDRVWWIWQLQNFEARLKDVSFTLTMSNNPPSRNGTLNDPTNLGLLAGDVLIADLMNTMGGLNGELCYIYV
jgi:tyrosinase